MSDYSPFTGRHPGATVAGARQKLWHVVGPSNAPIVCNIYRDAAGLEVRCHWAESIDALIRSERAADVDIATTSRRRGSAP